VRSHGGKCLGVSKLPPNAVELVEGTRPIPDGFAIITFPSVKGEGDQSFLDDPEYAPYKKARIAGTESSFFAFENDDNAPQFVGQSVRDFDGKCQNWAA
jgi:uncharacterized protein (DUF1330 family)